MTVDELQKKYPQIQWLDYMNTLLAPDNKIDYDEVIIVSVPSYISELITLLDKTPKRYYKNYIPNHFK